jgi:fructose-bisphosphate aldolase, class I
MRMRRLVRPDSGRCIMLAVSHGTSTKEIFAPLEDTPAQIDGAFSGGADCVLVSAGFAAASSEVFRRYPHKGYVAKLSATAYESEPRETTISTVEKAAADGADAVGVLMQLTPSTERSVIAMISRLGEDCERYGLPFIVEAEWPGAYDKNSWFPDDVVAYLRRACRLAQELGADLVKTNWPGDADRFADVISTITVPSVVAGGSKISVDDLVGMIEGAISAGAIGCSVGRNIFQASDPRAVAERIAGTVHARAAAAV